jgi:hypothetical protein
MDVFPDVFQEFLFGGGQGRVHRDHEDRGIHLGQVIIGDFRVVTVNRTHPGSVDDAHAVLEIRGRVGDLHFLHALLVLGVAFFSNKTNQFS